MLIELIATFLLLLFVYLLYTRIILVYSTISTYKAHGVHFHRGIVPFLGSFPELLKVARRKCNGNQPYIELVKEMYPGGKGLPQVTGVVYGQRVCLLINRPEAAEVVMLSKNKYFDKHPSTKIIA
jgi:hypothetical protein